MLKRLFGCSLKIVRLAQIPPNTRCRCVTAFILPQKRNYASTVPAYDSLSDIIKKFTNQAKNRAALSDTDLQTLLTTLKTRPADSVEALELLRCCTQARTGPNQTDIVHDIWKELKRHNRFQIEHYSYLLQFAKDKRNTQLAQEIFDEMIKDGIRPDGVSYHKILSLYCLCGNAEKATEICDMMEKNNVIIKENSFNHLVQCHIICGNIDAANKTIAKIKERRFKVNYSSLQSLLSHYAKAGDVKNIDKTVELFNQDNWKLMNRDVMKVMCELSVNGHSDKIDALLVHLKPLKYGGSLHNAIIYCIENKQSPIVPKILQSADGDIIGMFKLLVQEMVRLSSSDHEFNETITNIEQIGMTKPVIDSLFDAGSIEAMKIQKFYEINGYNQIGSLLKEMIAQQMAQNTGKIADETVRLKLFTYIRDENITDIEALMQSGKYTLAASEYASVIDLYTRLGNLDAALKLQRKALNAIKTFKLNHVKVAKLVTLMVENECDFNDIVNVLRAHAQYKFEFRIFQFDILFKKLVDSGRSELIEKLFYALAKYGYITPSAQSTKSIILVYLKNQSFAKAVEKYDYFVTKYKFAPITRVLFTHLIENKQLELLQRAISIYEKLDVGNAPMRCLASAYTQCGLDADTRSILEKFDGKTLATYIIKECKEYIQYSQFRGAKTLLRASKGLKCDRHLIYLSTLDICEKQNNTKEALELWHDYSTEDGIRPRIQFQTKLVEFLSANNIEIPHELKNIEIKRHRT